MGQARNWMKDELEYLEEHWGNTSITSIAKKLNRSVDGIKIKASRMHLGPFLDSSEYVSLMQVIEAFGMSYTWTRRIWEREGIPLHRKKVCNNSFLMVDIDEFWEWAEQHKELIDFSRLERHTFGKEPEWVEKIRKVDYKNNRKVTPWTKNDDRVLEDMLKRGTYHINDIAQRLMRTEGAVKRRIYDLALPYKYLKHEQRKWSDEEVQEMLKLRAEGNRWETIGNKLGRSGSSCRGKFEMLCNPTLNKRESRNNRFALKNCFVKNQCTHFRRALGCELKGTDCDTCKHFCRRKSEEKVETGWKSTGSYSAASELLEKLKRGENNG